MYYWYRVMGNLYDLIVAVYLLLTPLLIMRFSSDCYRRLRTLLGISLRNSDEPFLRRKPLKGVRGDLLMLSLGQPEYFERLSHSWEIHFQQQHNSKRFSKVFWCYNFDAMSINGWASVALSRWPLTLREVAVIEYWKIYSILIFGALLLKLGAMHIIQLEHI